MIRFNIKYWIIQIIWIEMLSNSDNLTILDKKKFLVIRLIYTSILKIFDFFLNTTKKIRHKIYV